MGSYTPPLKRKESVGLKFSCNADSDLVCTTIFDVLQIKTYEIVGYQPPPGNSDGNLDQDDKGKADKEGADDTAQDALPAVVQPGEGEVSQDNIHVDAHNIVTDAAQSCDADGGADLGEVTIEQVIGCQLDIEDDTMRDSDVEMSVQRPTPPSSVRSGRKVKGRVKAWGVKAWGVKAGGVKAGGVKAGGVKAGGVKAGSVKAGGVKAGGVKAGGVKAGGVKAGGVKAGGVKAGYENSHLKTRGKKLTQSFDHIRMKDCAAKLKVSEKN
nr:uncharacterized protein LOC123771200 [Procambarus clarkii]